MLSGMPNRKKHVANSHGIHLVSGGERKGFVSVMCDIIRNAKAGKIKILSVTRYDFGQGKNKYVENRLQSAGKQALVTHERRHEAPMQASAKA